MTKLNYLENTYEFSSTGQIIDIVENELGTAIILDQTIFYPQGGGQASDIGEIIGKNGIFVVNKTGLNQEGIVLHFGNFKEGILNKGDAVKLNIDKEKRLLNAKLHSAGHLIAGIITDILKLPIMPFKGHHFQDGSYVECNGEITNTDEVKKQVQQQLDIFINQGLLINIKNLDFNEAQKIGLNTPMGKSARLIGIEGFKPVGCGGTHVNNIKEIGKIIINKISSKKGSTKISYSII